MAVPIFEVSAISFGPVDVGMAEQSYRESVWEFKNWKQPGPRLGEVEILETPTDKGTKTYVASFTFDDGTRIVVTGDLPGGQNWIGKGKGLAQGGGKPNQDVAVEGKNPKRWG